MLPPGLHHLDVPLSVADWGLSSDAETVPTLLVNVTEWTEGGVFLCSRKGMVFFKNKIKNPQLCNRHSKH